MGIQGSGRRLYVGTPCLEECELTSVVTSLECPGESGVLRGPELFELAVCGRLCAELGVRQGHKDESGFCLSGRRHRVR